MKTKRPWCGLTSQFSISIVALSISHEASQFSTAKLVCGDFDKFSNAVGRKYAEWFNLLVRCNVSNSNLDTPRLAAGMPRAEAVIITHALV